MACMIRKEMANGAMLTSRNLAKNLGESPGLATAICLAQRCARKRIIDTSPAAAAKATMVVIVVTVVVVTVVIIIFLFLDRRITQANDFVNMECTKCNGDFKRKEIQYENLDRAIIFIIRTPCATLMGTLG